LTEKKKRENMTDASTTMMKEAFKTKNMFHSSAMKRSGRRWRQSSQRNRFDISAPAKPPSMKPTTDGKKLSS